jgi:hypothetical protein
MPKTSYYIDPNTGCRVIEDGVFKRCSRALSMAMHRLQTVIGSVPGLPGFGSRLYTIQRQGPNFLNELRTMADEALRPGRGTDFAYYEVETFRNDAFDPCLRVRVWSVGETEPEKIVIPY